ncbi:MAG: 30S ribosomal protein S6e [Thermoplasmata archaeon]
MVEFQVSIADPKEGKSFQTKVDGHHANSLIGKNINDKVDGIFVGLPGYKLRITGGSDSGGFPMKKGMPSPGRKRIIGKKGVGFKSNPKHVRLKKTVRGGRISADISQINMKVVEHGPKKVSDVFQEDKGED